MDDAEPIRYRIAALSPTRPLKTRIEEVRKNDDRMLIEKIGKRPVLKRTFGFTSMLAFSTTVVSSWEGIIQSFQLSYVNGGPTSAFIGFILVWFGLGLTYAVMSEMASMAPTAGGQYHWVSMLAPRRARSFFSFLTGWMTVIGWQSSAAAGAYNNGLTLRGLIALCNPSYEPENWHTALLSWAVLLFAVFINTAATTALAKFEGLALILHVLLFFAILVPMVTLGQHNDPANVFSLFENGGGWQTQGLSFMVGLIGAANAFSGGDCAFHMAEEIRNSAVIIPRVLIANVILNGAIGLAMLVALLFCMGPPALAQENIINTSLGFPYVQVILNSTGSVTGTTILVSTLFAMGVASTAGFVATASRQLWAFSRDHGLPYSHLVSKVDRRTSIPVVSVALTTAIGAILCLIGIGSYNAFQQIISISVAGIYSSYMITLTLLFWRRITNAIRFTAADLTTASATSGKDTVKEDKPEVQPLIWGPYRIPGMLGIVLNAVALVFLITLFFFAFWPPLLSPTPGTMTWTCLVFGAITLFCVLWYFIAGHKVYKGPVWQT